MAQLPVELLNIIASFSSSNDLPRLSTISRAWQSAVERRTMRSIQLKSTDLQHFSNIFVHQNRRAALVELSYNAILPAYSDHQCARFETDGDKQQNNQALTDAIRSLLSLLHSWDDRAAGLSDSDMASHSRPAAAGRISWTLNAYSPTDVDHRENVDVQAQRFQAQLAGGRKDLFEHRYERSFLRMFNCEELPVVSRIGAFRADEMWYRRRIEGRSLAGIAAKLPNLETVVWTVNDDEKRDVVARQMHRFEFAQCLTTLSAQWLKLVSLTLFNQDPSNQSFILPSALPQFAPTTDHLSLALHTLSQSPNLTRFSLKGDIVLSPCFFWPDDDPPTVTPFWPRLEFLDVNLNITTPTGHWLYMRDPSRSSPDPDPDPDDEDPLTLTEILRLDESSHSSDSDNSEVPDIFSERVQEYLDGAHPSNQFRTIIDGERLNPMLTAMARAACHMPAMGSLTLHVNTKSLSGLDVQYITTTSKLPHGPNRRWEVFIGEEAKWNPPDDLQEEWRKSARGGAEATDAAEEEDLIMIDYY